MRAMVSAAPVKPEYGPTLGRLLSPRWRAASSPARALVCALGAVAVALLVGLVLSLQDAKFAQRDPVAFHFLYRDLYRETPPPGGYVLVARHSGGRLLDSFAVSPLTLPDGSGSVTGVLPLVAAARERQLALHDPNFALESEGKVRVNLLAGYAINYSTRVDGREMDGRDVLIVPPVSGAARQGVVLAMLTRASPLITDVYPVGNSGVLHQPEHTFTFGS